MKFDSYSIKGRILPALFSIVIPIMIFNHFYVSEEFSKFTGYILGAKLASNLTISLVALYFLSEVGRFFGKNIFESKIFLEEKYMPTTSFLTFADNQYSNEHKLKIREKISNDFSIQLPSEKEEIENEDSCRVRIVETMALIRKKLHGNEFLFQHNVEYGAIRNIIGGSVLGVVFSIFNVIFFYAISYSKLAVIISLATFSLYFLLIIFSKKIIDFYGNNYAKVLYREYLSS